MPCSNKLTFNNLVRFSFSLKLRTQFERDQKQNVPVIRADEDKNVDDPKDADTVGNSSNAEHTAADEDAALNKDKDIIANKDNDGTNRESDGFTLSIWNDLSAVENFLKLNKLVKNYHRIIPLSPQEHGFLSFSERELLVLFCGRPLLQDRIRSWADHTFSTKPSIDDLKNIWLDTMEPGFLIKMLLADVGPKDLTSRHRGKAGYRGAIKFTTMDDIKDHLRPLRQDTFDPREYNSKGYALRGSIRTDGYRLQLLGFKLKELQRCRYNRPCRYPLPPKLTSTIGGVDYFLTEIRNVAKTPAHVAQLWPHCQPDAIKILCIDLGQAFVVGASALLPDTTDSTVPTQSTAPAASTAQTLSNASTVLTPISTSSPSSSSSQTFHNVAVSQKAVFQPTLRHRRWLEEAKTIVPEGGGHTISDLESSLPPLRGEGASVIKYLEELERVQEPLDDFYNGKNLLYKRHAWDAERARKEEFRTIANRLLNSIGGSVGATRRKDNMVVIGIGLGQFKSNSGLSSLHTSFLSYFVQLVSFESSQASVYVCNPYNASFINMPCLSSWSCCRPGLSTTLWWG